jgi:hypothetical protein
MAVNRIAGYVSALIFVALPTPRGLSQISEGNNAHLFDDLAQAREKWLEITTNPEIFPCTPYTPSKKGCDPINDIKPAGDMILFNSLLCYSGYEPSCSAVTRSQESSGRWRRSPLHVDGPIIHASGSFSKDHAVGLLLYFVVTHDRENASRWFDWIVAEASPQIPPVLKVCEKQHCTITPTLFSLMYKVWRNLGLKPSKNMEAFKNYATDAGLAAEARQLNGFELHIKGAMALLLSVLGEHPEQLIQTLVSRQPDNPFYQFLARREKGQIIENTLRKCAALSQDDYPNNPGNQWSWERDTAEAAWEHTMGWDCIFMANLLLRSP